MEIKELTKFIYDSFVLNQGQLPMDNDYEADIYMSKENELIFEIYLGTIDRKNFKITIEEIKQ